ncbi:MFS transporter [Lipingzhangella sp. LS1_29]|uniref:MFS transporter n=1 Tax=Lipingzhangella rawalii TaxID=2055835 RepID=A0ABU2H0Z3_9ACTN|nr:MFS transporter [Lipingzhangella rawalii]MDS1268973.1 MFS transporter [Lipingzhangella rawalii]
MTNTPTPPTNLPSNDPRQRRREQRGWYLYDWANQVFWTSVVTVFLGPYLAELARAAAQGSPSGEHVYLLGLAIHYNAVWPLATALAPAIQIPLLPVVGAIADRSRTKKRLLLGFATVGASATTCLYLASGDNYLLAVGLFLVANVSYGAALVVYNAFLPEIATADERDRVSSTGWAFAYLGGVVLLLVHLALVLNAEALGVGEGHAVRIAFASAGLWWLGFTLLAVRPLRNRVAPAATADRPASVGATFRQLWHTLRELRRYPQTLLYLCAYLLFNDGIQATIRFAGPYATGEQDLGLDMDDLITTVVMIQFVAFAGAWLTGRLATVLGTKRTLVAILVCWTLILTSGYFLPAGQALPFMALGFCIGLVLGGSQALARSLFSQLIPRGKEGEYFGLYTICDRAGTLTAALVGFVAVQLTGGYRAAIFSLVAFFIVGGVLLVLANLRRGVQQAGNPVPAHL